MNGISLVAQGALGSLHVEPRYEPVEIADLRWLDRISRVDAQQRSSIELTLEGDAVDIPTAGPEPIWAALLSFDTRKRLDALWGLLVAVRRPVPAKASAMLRLLNRLRPNPAWLVAADLLDARGF